MADCCCVLYVLQDQVKLPHGLADDEDGSISMTMECSDRRQHQSTNSHATNSDGIKERWAQYCEKGCDKMAEQKKKERWPVKRKFAVNNGVTWGGVFNKHTASNTNKCCWLEHIETTKSKYNDGETPNNYCCISNCDGNDMNAKLQKYLILFQYSQQAAGESKQHQHIPH